MPTSQNDYFYTEPCYTELQVLICFVVVAGGGGIFRFLFWDEYLSEEMRRVCFFQLILTSRLGNLTTLEMLIKNIPEFDILHLKPIWAKYCSPQNIQFCNFLKLASDVFSTHGPNIIFPKWILRYLETSISMQALLLIWFMWKEYFRRN